MDTLRKDKANIKVVIGANYGDEGKGLMTDYFSRTLSQGPEGRRGLVVLSNGGAQRGHTVTVPDGTRVVFHHFGSGTLAGYDTYCPARFILNPAQFVREHRELDSLVSPDTFIHRYCRWATPLDMILNQARLIKDDRMNSCGMGVWETIKRYRYFENEQKIAIPTLEDFVQMPYQLKDIVLSHFVEYFYHMLDEYGIDPEMNPRMKELFSFDYVGLCRHFIDDCQYMIDHSLVVSSDQLAFSGYQNIVFENAQGLAIGGQLIDDEKNNTPTDTGIRYALRSIENCFEGQDVEVCYVSRSYLTRHGLGELENECTPDQISLSIEPDQTNISNIFQGSLRYGRLDLEKLAHRVSGDFIDTLKYVHNKYSISMAFTHMNEVEPAGFDDFLESAFQHDIERVYVSDGYTYQDVREVPLFS